MQDFLILWLPWIALAAGVGWLIYAISRQYLRSAAATVGALVLLVGTIIVQAWHTSMLDGAAQKVARKAYAAALDFPEWIDTRPVRFQVDDGLTWIVKNWGDGFEAAASPLLFLLNAIQRFLLFLPWWFIFIVLIVLAWLATRKIALSIVVLVALLFLGVMELWEDAVKTMALMISATLTAIAFSIPVGILMARKELVRRILSPVLDLMQTLPSFVYLIPVVMIFGPGKIPALIATIIYAAPPLVRLTDLGIRMVDQDVMEAARAFGTTPRQRLFGVQIPLALPTILAGVNQTTMMALAMVVIASMIGAGGLGYQVLQGIGRLEVSRGLFAGLGIVALAIIFDRITQAFGKRLQARIGLSEVR